MAGAAATDFGVRGLVRAFGRRLVAIERKQRGKASSTTRWTRLCLGDKSYPAEVARSIADAEIEYGRRSVTARQRIQAAWARTFSFVLALAQAAGVNC